MIILLSDQLHLSKKTNSRLVYMLWNGCQWFTVIISVFFLFSIYYYWDNNILKTNAFVIRYGIVISLYYNNDQSECCFLLLMQFYGFVQTTFYDRNYGKPLTVYRINRNSSIPISETEFVHSLTITARLCSLRSLRDSCKTHRQVTGIQ